MEFQWSNVVVGTSPMCQSIFLFKILTAQKTNLFTFGEAVNISIKQTLGPISI